MMKNNSNELGTYVSPAIKVAQLNPRRVMCQSPFGETGNAGKFYDDDDPNVHDYGDNVL